MYFSKMCFLYSIFASQEPIIREKATMFADYVYSKPYTRITPYLVGLLLGNVLSRDVKIFKRNCVSFFCTYEK